jgi:hypothetical protein
MSSVLQDLYESEINFEIATDWDAGFRVRLGHAFNEKYDAEIWAHTAEEAIERLRQAAIERYPNSKFAKDYRKKQALAGVLTD